MLHRLAELTLLAATASALDIEVSSQDIDIGQSDKILQDYQSLKEDLIIELIDHYVVNGL